MPAENGFCLKGTQLVLYLRVQTRASKTRWGSRHDNWIKLRITAAPIEGQANKQCIEFLAKALRVPKSDISILQGETSRRKVIQINNVDLRSWEAVLQQIQIAK